MTSATFDVTSEAANPLDLLEDIFEANDWVCERFAEEELLAIVDGRWAQYRFGFVWRDDMKALCCSCLADLAVMPHVKSQIFELLALVNDQLLLGHFAVFLEESVLVFRYTLLMPYNAGGMVEQFEELIEIALTECERFYPAFKFVAKGQKEPEEALLVSVTETVGEA